MGRLVLSLGVPPASIGVQCAGAQQRTSITSDLPRRWRSRPSRNEQISRRLDISFVIIAIDGERSSRHRTSTAVTNFPRREKWLAAHNHGIAGGEQVAGKRIRSCRRK